MKLEKRKLFKRIQALGIAVILLVTGIQFPVQASEDVWQASEHIQQAAVDEDAPVNEEAFTVTVEARQNGVVLENPVITFTDVSGNAITNESGSAINIEAGEYTYVISDGGYNRVEGSLTVTESVGLQVELPSGEWFADIQIRNKEKKAFSSELNAETHVAEFLIDDTIGPNDLYLYTEQGDVPESKKTKLITCYTGTDGVDKSTRANSWNSNSNTLPKCLNTGMEGREFQLEAYYETGSYTQIQSYTMKLNRVPTLQNLVVKEGSAEGVSVLKNFNSSTTAYEVTTRADAVFIEAAAYAGEGYTIIGDGLVELGEHTSIEHTITVSHTNGQSREYLLTITKTDSISVTLTIPEGTTVQVQNENGAVIAPAFEAGNSYLLIPGETYSYIATKGEAFHTTAKFTAKDGLQVAVAEPETVHALQNFALYDTATASIREAFLCDTEFSKEKHSYSYIISDENSLAAAQATAIEGYSVTACYTKQSSLAAQHGAYYEKAITQTVDNTAKAIVLPQVIAACGYGQSVVIRLSKETEGVVWYQEYELHLERALHLDSIALKSNGEVVELQDEKENVIRFDAEQSEYYVSVAKGTESLTLNGSFVNEKTTTDICGGYSLEVDGKSYDSLTDIALSLNEEEEQTIEITVKHTNTKAVLKTYQLHIKKLEAVRVKFEITPKDAIVFMIHEQTGNRVFAKEDGSFLLLPGNAYTYTVTCNGYKGKQVKGYRTPTVASTVQIVLEKAQKNTTIDPTIEAQWSSFRNTPDNNGVTDTKIPIKSENTALYWATKLGSGYGSKATGCPIIVDGYIYTYAGKEIYKIDTMTGQLIATGTMVDASSFAINPPTYADGMIFIGLRDGKIQAFNADTLESLWVFQDEIGGQPNCTITYHDGYIYTGFWKGEMQEGNYVCISVTDEDITNSTEEKLPSWTYTSMGGFYWAGAYVCDDYMVVGTDDGAGGYTTGFGHVISLDPKSGEVLGDIQLPFVGDARSSMTLYEGKLYFTTKGGYFYEIAVGEDGTLNADSLRYIKLENGSENANNPAMSTSTPTIYNGRAYVGVSGISQFGAYSGHSITVLDLEKWEIAYSVPTQGYPQTSGMLTTAYEGEEETAYIYFFDNYTPGKLRIISDKPGQTQATLTTTEQYMQAGQTKTCEAAQVLFTPTGNHAQYALCSPIVDEYGTLYFKNDSAYLMAVGSTIEKIEVTKKPNKTIYQVGEKFDATGMKVVATYSNGATRDVTDYITCSEEPLTLEDDDFTIQFKHILYQDKNGETGVACEKPITSVRITVQKLVRVPSQKATTDKDGNIAYWKDTKTGKLYADAKRNKEITLSDIVIPKVSSVKLSTTKYTYNGKVKTPKVVVKNRAGRKLKEKTDYTLTYAKRRKNVGRYSVKVTYKGNYTGSKTLYFYINPAGTKLSKVTAGSKKLTVRWKKNTKQVTGYQIQYATSKSFKNAKTVTVKKNTTTKKSIKSLKAKKKYYVRIRTYKTVKIGKKNQKLYSAWSSAKQMTTKK